jgi:hypothetical protein
MLIKVNEGLLLRKEAIHLLDEDNRESISALVDGDHPPRGYRLSVVLAFADLPPGERKFGYQNGNRVQGCDVEATGQCTKGKV